MDNWLTILLAFVFFVLPLLEGILKKKKSPPGPPPGQEPFDPNAEGYFEGEHLPPQGADIAPEESWSDGWGSWPGDDAEERKEDPGRTWRADRPDPVAGGGFHQPSPPAPVPEKVVTRSAEKPRPEVGSVPENQRLQELADHLNRIAVEDISPAASRVATPLPTRKPRRNPARDRVTPMLRDNASLRNAVILTEVLGPPLASRG